MTKIHTKFHDPKKYEFKLNDLVNNTKEGKLFYKNNDNIYLLTSVISGSFSATGGANNQIATFNEAENITGEQFFTYNGDLLHVRGDISTSGTPQTDFSGSMYAHKYFINHENPNATLPTGGAIPFVQLANAELRFGLDPYFTEEYNGVLSQAVFFQYTTQIASGFGDDDEIRLHTPLVRTTGDLDVRSTSGYNIRSISCSGHISASKNLNGDGGDIYADEGRFERNVWIGPGQVSDSTSPRLRLSNPNTGDINIDWEGGELLFRYDTSTKIRFNQNGDITSSGRFDSTNDNFIFNGGNENQVIYVQSNDGDCWIDYEDDSTTDNVLIGAKGNDIYLRTDAGGIHTQGLNSAGGGNDVRFNTSTYELVYQSSTRKIKKNIIDIPTEELLKLFSKIKPRKFTYKIDDNEDYGFVAEEISEIDPLLAIWGEDFAYDEKGKKIKSPKKTDNKLEEPTYKLDSSNRVPIDINDRSLLAVAIAKIQELEQRIKNIEDDISI